MKRLIGIDIGGTKISVCLGDEKGTIVASRRIKTQPLNGAKNGLPAIVREIEQLLDDQKVLISQIAAIGILAPGPISTKGGLIISPPNLKGWENTRIVEYFEHHFHKKVCMNNDANAAGLAEYEFGASKGTPNLIYLTTSTGMGGGAIVNGQLVQGVSDTGAEVGHYVLDIHGPDCACGLKGCFEVYCGGAAIAKRMRTEIVEHKIDTQILREAGGDISKVDVICLIAALKKKDAYAQKIWDEFIVRLAQGIGIILMAFNPQAIILGTIAINAGPLLFEPLKKQLPRFAWKEPIESCRIEASQLGEKISELSALALAKQALLQ